MKTFLKYIFAVVITLLVAFIVVTNYSWIFAKSIDGVVFKVERVTDPTMVVGNVANNTAVLHSYAVAIQVAEGTIYTASSEDRQWSVVVPGCQVKATFFRYPFWELQKSGTYFNARLDDMKGCPSGVAPAVQPAQPAVPPGTPAPQ